MMNIPYEEILKLFEEKQNHKDSKNKLSNYINKTIRKRELKKIIKTLEESCMKDNVIYKSDIWNFCTFMYQLQNILKSNLVELQPNWYFYISKPDNVNYQIIFLFEYLSSKLLSTKKQINTITVRTVDTTSESNNYFLYRKQVQVEDEPIKTTQEYKDCINYNNYTNQSTYIESRSFYDAMIKTIIKYLELL